MSKLRVTKVCVESFTPKSEGTCAEVSVILDNALIIHKVFVINGDKGYFVAMPYTGQTRLAGTQKRYDDLVHPLSKALNDEIKSAVLEEFQKALDVNSV